MISDEEVNARQVKIAKLRQDALDAEIAADQAQREHANEITMAKLDAEEAALQARLDDAKTKGDPEVLKADLERRTTQMTPEQVEKQFGKGVEVQHQDDGSVVVLSVKGGEDAPDLPVAVTENTAPEPTPDPIDLEVKTRKTTAKD